MYHNFKEIHLGVVVKAQSHLGASCPLWTLGQAASETRKLQGIVQASCQESTVIQGAEIKNNFKTNHED